jgi:2-phosphosulfolactate phosphatase
MLAASPCEQTCVLRGFVVFLLLHRHGFCMRVDVRLSPAEFPAEYPREALIVLIDVLRTSTTFCVGLMHGARGFIPCSDAQEALRRAALLNGSAVLAGEYLGEPLPGFALENSPEEYTEERVRGKLIVFTSTNGAPLLRRLPDGVAPTTVVAGMVNCGELVARCRQHPVEQLLLLCAGHRGELAYEDVLGAGTIVARVVAEIPSAELTDRAHVAWAVYRDAAPALLPAVLQRSSHARRLHARGRLRDIERALQEDSAPVLPWWSQGMVVPWTAEP